MQEPGSEYVGAEGAAGTGTGRTWEAEQLRAEETASEVGRRARQIRDEASQTVRSAKQRLGVAYDRTTDQAARAYRGAREYAQANPGVAAVVTFAAGLGAGMMVGGRNGTRAYRQGLIPVVAIALAQAVLDVFEEAR